MNTLIARSRNFLFLLAHLRFKAIVAKIRRRLHRSVVCYGLRRDLETPFAVPAASIPITVRPLRKADVPKIFNTDGASTEAARELMNRMQHLRADIPTCYVAVTADDDPCYLQWLMGPEQNEKIRIYFNGIFPTLKPNEALLENAYTLERYRGKKIMPCAMAQIAAKATEIGARYVITFVEVNNIASLKGCHRAGFYPYTLRTERWSFFRHLVAFTLLPEGTSYPFEV
jgi:hypothetical protein